MRRLLALLRDPVTRPRVIVWLGIVTMIAVIFWAAGIVGTSFPWFCEEPCHIVHADNTLTYNAGTHSKVTCVACHEPVNASPITFTLMKIFVLPDLYSTATRTFHLPMNPENEVALKMPEGQCTQCHVLGNRTVNPTRGIKIDHDAHTSRGIKCTICHNRIAHPEADVTYTLAGDRKHEDWAKMDACFRCHGLGKDAVAPGACTTCHTPSFDLVPASHKQPGWYAKFGDSKGHAKAAQAEIDKVAETSAEKPATVAKKPGETWPADTRSSSVNACYTCHKTDFCSSCHGGLQMPHPTDFKKSHGKLGESEPQVCARCHARSAAEATGKQFCSACHHPDSTPGGAWLSQHPAAVARKGTEVCFTCHQEMQCSYCHVNGVAAGRDNLHNTYSR